MSLKWFRVSTFYNNTAVFTSVPGHVCLCSLNFFEIISLLAAFLEAFRAIIFPDLFSFDQQVAVPAAQLFFLPGQEYEGVMFA